MVNLHKYIFCYIANINELLLRKKRQISSTLPCRQAGKTQTNNKFQLFKFQTLKILVLFIDYLEIDHYLLFEIWYLVLKLY